MKNLILTLLTVFAFTFSFAQSNTAKEDAVKLKKNSVEVVDYLASELKLEDKEKAALSNAFAEYAHNIAKLNEKLDAKGSKMSDKEGQLDTSKLMEEATNICGSMQGNPLFSSLMGMQGDMMKNMGQEPSNQGDSSQTKKINLNNPSHDPNPTKQRLQRKLKEKQSQNMTILI